MGKENGMGALVAAFAAPRLVTARHPFAEQPWIARMADGFRNTPHGYRLMGGWKFIIAAWMLNLGGLALAAWTVARESAVWSTLGRCDSFAMFFWMATLVFAGNVFSLAFPEVRSRLPRAIAYLIWGSVVCGGGFLLAALILIYEPGAIAEAFRISHPFAYFYAVAVVTLLGNAALMVCYGAKRP